MKGEPTGKIAGIKSAVGTLRWRLKRWVNPVRTHVLKRRVQPGVILHVYWKEEVLGHGPCASLYIGRSEVLRFDCFGKGGHYHVHVQEQEKRGPALRLDFGTPSVEEQIDRSFDMLLWAREHLLSSDHARIREFPLDIKRLEQAAAWMRETLHEYMNTRGRCSK